MVLGTTGGTVFVFDTQSKQVVRSIPLIDDPNALTGPILEVTPGRMLGLTHDPENSSGSILYGLDVDSGEVLFRKSVPGRLGFRWSHGISDWDYRMGPDGYIYTFLNGVLVRIDPESVSVEPVGKVSPGRIAFVGRDAYLAGAEHIRRIPDLAGPAE